MYESSLARPDNSVGYLLGAIDHSSERAVDCGCELVIDRVGQLDHFGSLANYNVTGVAAVESSSTAHVRVAVLEQLGALLAQIVHAELALAARVSDGKGGAIPRAQLECALVTSMLDHFNAGLVALKSRMKNDNLTNWVLYNRISGSKVTFFAKSEQIIGPSERNEPIPQRSWFCLGIT